VKKIIIPAGIVIFCCSLGWEFLSIAALQNGSYRVEFTGTPRAKVYGVTGWLDLNDPSETLHSNKVASDLPATVFLSPPSGTIVVASGLTINQGDVNIGLWTFLDLLHLKFTYSLTTGE
jgi:hypothetical protein